MARAVVIGEALVDLIEDHDPDGAVLFRPRFGGSPLNVAVGVRRLGVDVEFVGAFGADVFGQRMQDFLRDESVGVGASFTTALGTCLAVAMSKAGHMTFEYFGDFGSLTAIPTVDPAVLDGAGVVHAGSTAFNVEPVYGAALEAYRRAAGMTTMDPNPRPFLIEDREAYRERLERAMALVLLVKLSGDDLDYLYPSLGHVDAARHIASLGPSAVIVTEAAADTIIVGAGDVARVPVPPIAPVDTTGAGDAFMAALIARLAAGAAPADVDGWRELAAIANEAAALSCLAIGGATGMPSAAMLDERLERGPA